MSEDTPNIISTRTAELLSSNSAGTVVHKRLLPIAITLPVLASLVFLVLRSKNLLPESMGLAIADLLAMVLASTAVYWAARGVDARERERVAKLVWLQLQQERIIFDAVPAQIWFKDENSVVLRANKCAAAAFGKSIAEIEGRPTEALFPRDGAKYRADDLQVINSGTAKYGIIEPLLTINGETRWVHTDKIPIFSEKGRIEGVVVLSLDITDRILAERALRESEQRYRQIVQTATEGIWLIDANAITSYVNAAMATMLGVEIAQLMGTSFLAHVAPNSRYAAERLFAGTDHGDVMREEMCFIRKDGELVWALVSASPNFDVHGETQGVLVMATDISERRAAEIELQKAKDTAEAANRAKDEFLGVLSHELRTPMNIVIGWARLLATSKLDDETAGRGLEALLRAATVQTRLIDDLLDMASIEARQFKMRRDAVDLAALLHGVIASLEQPAKEKQITLQIEAPRGAGKVEGDSDRLHQAMWNLVANALKFSARGGQVDVCLVNTSSEVEITVRDEGEGIDPEALARVFERFWQEDASTSRRHGGLGLGLAIAREIIERHNGQIAIASPGKGKGTTVTVRLPHVLPERTTRVAVTQDG